MVLLYYLVRVHNSERKWAYLLLYVQIGRQTVDMDPGQITLIMSESQFSQRPPAGYKGSGRQVEVQRNDEPSDDMYQQLAGLVKDMKCVMRNFKVFFNKYLLPQQNQFSHQSRPAQHSVRALQPERAQPNHYHPSTQLEDYYQPRQQRFQSNQLSSSTYKPFSTEKHEKQKKKHNFTSKKSKANVDPNKPKSPLTPYFMFFQENRDILRKRYPEMSLAEIGSLGGKIWRHLSEEQKQTYRDRYEEEKRVFKLKMRTYNSSGGYLQSRMVQKKDYPQVTQLQPDEF